jgi:hypothetical protein
MDEVKREAKRRKIKLLILPTAEAIETLRRTLRTPMPYCTSPADECCRGMITSCAYPLAKLLSELL